MKKLQLNIYMNEADMAGDIPLYEDIVRRLLHLDVAGATVMRGLMGYGSHGKVHRKRLFGVSDDRPLVITAIDGEARIRSVIPEIRATAPEAFITLQEVEIP